MPLSRIKINNHSQQHILVNYALLPRTTANIGKDTLVPFFFLFITAVPPPVVMRCILSYLHAGPLEYQHSS